MVIFTTASNLLPSTYQYDELGTRELTCTIISNSRPDALGTTLTSSYPSPPAHTVLRWPELSNPVRQFDCAPQRRAATILVEMVAVYELLPTADQERVAEDTGFRSSLLCRMKSVYSALDVLSKAFRAHADALNDAWLSELERLGTPVFVCFMLLRVGLLSLAVFWGFLIVGPLWCISLVSSDRFLPSAIQAGLIVTLLIIVEPLLFVALMKDPRSKVFHVLYSMHLLVGWREICVYLVRDEILGRFASRPWVRDLIFTFASAAVLGCGALGWTMWEGWPRRVWTLYIISSVLFLQMIYLTFRTDG